MFMSRIALEMSCSDGEVLLTNDFDYSVPQQEWRSFSKTCTTGFHRAEMKLEPPQVCNISQPEKSLKWNEKNIIFYKNSILVKIGK